jgi:hypothetical protein
MKNNKRKATVGIGTLLCLIIGWYTAYTIFDTHVYFEVWSSKTPFPNDKEKYEILGKGSIQSYIKVRDSIRNDNRIPYPNYLYYSLIMVNRYNYVPANYDVYMAFKDLYSPKNKVAKMDEMTRYIAFFYLERGAYKGDISSIKEMRRLGLDIPRQEPIYIGIDKQFQ